MRQADRRYWKRRRAIIFALYDTGLYSHGAIAEIVGLDRSTVSYHLARRSRAFRWIITGVPSRINDSMGKTERRRIAA